MLLRADLEQKANKIADVAALSNQRGGRIRIASDGRAVETVLSLATAVDVSIAALPVAQSAKALVGHVGLHLTRVADDEFEVIVLRSFAEGL